MKPPACVSCKWGKGTTCEKPTNSHSSKEVTTKLEQMMAERAKQDAKWFAVPKQEEPSEKKKTGIDGSY
jgi:hypothetical protein